MVKLNNANHKNLRIYHSTQTSIDHQIKMNKWFFENCKTENASVLIDENWRALEWMSGDFLDGDFYGLHFYEGTFHNGIWNGNMFHNGIVLNAKFYMKLNINGGIIIPNTYMNLKSILNPLHV